MENEQVSPFISAGRFFADDDITVDGYLKLKGGQLSVWSTLVKGKSFLAGLTKRNLCRHKYNGDEECLYCRKCLPDRKKETELLPVNRNI